MGRDSLQTEAAPTLTCPPLIGACGCALGLFWFILFYDDPKDHPCISVAEKEFITSSLMAQVNRTCTVGSPGSRTKGHVLRPVRLMGSFLGQLEWTASAHQGHAQVPPALGDFPWLFCLFLDKPCHVSLLTNIYQLQASCKRDRGRVPSVLLAL